MDEIRQMIAAEIPRLRRYALTLTNDPHHADDLVQDCLERALRKHRQWRRHGSIRNWLYRIQFHVFINQLPRQERRRLDVDIGALPLIRSTLPDQEHRVALRQIGLAMQTLPPEQRAAVALTAVEGLSYDEAAAVLDIPIGTLRSRLSRGRDRLRTIFDGAAADESTEVASEFDGSARRPSLRQVK